MMRCIVTYHDLAKKAIVESSGDHKIAWNIVYNQTKPLFVRLSQMKFEVFKEVFFNLIIFRILNKVNKNSVHISENSWMS